VLGDSKRIAERMTAGAAGRTPGKFVSVRFGNVLGSRGSVLPAFAHQIASGGSVAVIHPDVTRFFMMIPEACELVIQAAAAGRDDVEIVFTGLRGGEKMHEELLGQAEGTRTTSHELIDAVQVQPLRIAQVRRSGMRWGEAQGAA
jgi:FlaA1/EpsC-like NDP-sugar epimerase